MSDVTITELWFKRAILKPVEKQQIQVAVHFEEFSEMLEQMAPVEEADTLTAALLSNALKAVKELSQAMKDKQASLKVTNRKLYVDALADQIVTATGSGFVYGCNVPLALTRVNTSNFSKFDENGMPIFDANGKIAKNPATYKEADFTGCY